MKKCRKLLGHIASLSLPLLVPRKYLAKAGAWTQYHHLWLTAGLYLEYQSLSEIRDRADTLKIVGWFWSQDTICILAISGSFGGPQGMRNLGRTFMYNFPLWMKYLLDIAYSGHLFRFMTNVMFVCGMATYCFLPILKLVSSKLV